MAEKMEETNQKKVANKKIATGSTKKAVQKRSSSVAGKKGTSETATKKTTRKTSATTKIESKKTSKVEEKKETPKKTRTKKEVMPDAVDNLETNKTKEEAASKKVNKKNTKSKIIAENKEKYSLPKEELERIDEKEEFSRNSNKKKHTELTEVEDMELIEKEIAKEKKSNKKAKKVEENKINSRIFENVCFAIIIMVYLNFIILGFVNIETQVFLTDLKVFSVALLVVAIGIFEYAYKKDSGRDCVHGIEMLALAFSTMGLVYTQLMLEAKFIYIAVLITLLFAIYYVAKCIIIYKKMKKEYAIANMKEIIKNGR